MRKSHARWMKRTLWWSVVAWSLLGYGGVAQAEHKDSDDGPPGHIVTHNHEVAHTSTVPANFGEPVKLFVRERVRGDQHDGPRKAVLMIHGRSVPVLPSTALDREGYDWSLELAKAGLDVFLLDFQGSGRSPRPKMHNHCNVPDAQLPLVTSPYPPGSCPDEERYLFQLTNSQSDWDELDTVVDYIRSLRGVDKVALVSWSQGSFRIGPYAAADMTPDTVDKTSDKVESLLLFAPIFNPIFPDAPPAKLPPSGTPMSLNTRTNVMAAWNTEKKCEGQVEEGMQDVVWRAIMENDELGSKWGPPPAGAPAGSPPEGVMRVRTPTLWGWNKSKASQLHVPVLIIAGEYDEGAGGVQKFNELYEEIPNPNKLGFTVQCAGHFMQWERQRRILHHISKQWLKHRAVEDFTTGRFFVSTEGDLEPGNFKK